MLRTALLRYQAERTSEYQQSKQEHRTRLLGLNFGISYKNKMDACDQLLKAMNGDNIVFSNENLKALTDGKLAVIIANYSAEWPAAFRAQHPLRAAIVYYMKKRTTEFEHTNQQYHSTFFGKNPSYSYACKMTACQKVLQELDGKKVQYTVNEFHALTNATLANTLNKHDTMWPPIYRKLREQAAEMTPSRLASSLPF